MDFAVRRVSVLRFYYRRVDTCHASRLKSRDGQRVIKMGGGVKSQLWDNELNFGVEIAETKGYQKLADHFLIWQLFDGHFFKNARLTWNWKNPNFSVIPTFHPLNIDWFQHAIPLWKALAFVFPMVPSMSWKIIVVLVKIAFEHDWVKNQTLEMDPAIKFVFHHMNPWWASSQNELIWPATVFSRSKPWVCEACTWC